ncbi:MAG TPA: 30S ribosomal protein S12 methylthiotransferase RimO [Dehalococcoidia bacterium]|nr:30S ribosomal protein S12 methylthiotransferase RimO [Dehalococcoidia bacterium]
MRFHIVTLGCPKNAVDSDGMTDLLLGAGHSPVDQPRQADALIVNTCGFIGPAKEESVNAILDLAARKRSHQLLIAAGCLVQRYADDLRQEIPELDAVLSTREWFRIPEVVRGAAVARGLLAEDQPIAPVRAGGPAAIAARPTLHSAYLKIADGCNAPCTFCIIPTIKGNWVSKPPAEVVAQARRFVERGAQEVVLIAQDSTAYGWDRGGRDGLADLLARICDEVPELPWLRVMYAYPSRVTQRLIEVMVTYPQICHYLDMPLQHGDENMLRRMKRPARRDLTLDLIARLRAAMPDIALRTSFIVGFPGETETEFRNLLDFMEEIAFDHVGVFTYSPEEGTPAAEMTDQVPEREKRRRYRRAMAHQQAISLRRNQAQVGRILPVLIEGETVEAPAAPNRRRPTESEGPSVVGRTYRDTPEVDGFVLACGKAPVGRFAQVRITKALPYDLVGEIVTA